MTKTNSEHLEAVKERDEKWLTEHRTNPENDFMTNMYIDYRTVKALEIIAETLIDLDETLQSIIGRNGSSINVTKV